MVKRLGTLLVGTLVVVSGYLAIGAVTQAATTTQYIFCVMKTTGTMRLVSGSQTCKSTENRITLGAVGPQGAPGATGPRGATGAPGPTGAPGTLKTYFVYGSGSGFVVAITMNCRAGDIALSGGVSSITRNVPISSYAVNNNASWFLGATAQPVDLVGLSGYALCLDV